MIPDKKWVKKRSFTKTFFNLMIIIQKQPPEVYWTPLNWTASDNNTLTFREEKPKWTFVVAFIVVVVIVIIALHLSESIEEIKFSC